MAKPLFPTVPEDVSQISDSDLDALIEEGEAAISKVESGDTDGRSHSELLDEVKKGVDGLKRVRAEKDRRVAEVEKEQAQMAELLAQGRGADDPDTDEERGPDPDEEPEPDPDAEPDEVTEPVAVAASGRDYARAKGTTGDRLIETAQEKNRLRLARTRPEHRPVIESAQPAAITASSDIDGFSTGQNLESGLEIARAFMAKFRNLGASTVEVNVPVVKVSWADSYPEERKLDGGMTETGLAERIRKAVGLAPRGQEEPDAILASGGLCAPVEIRYDLPVLAQADRPVRDSLTNFNAARGGIRFAAPPSLASITTGVGRITAAQDAAGGSPGTKHCQVITCPTFTEVDVAAIYHCLQFGNLGARAYPELVENATALALAAQARLADTALLDGMVAASTRANVNLQPNNTNPLGATAILLPALIVGAAAMRNRQRMGLEAILDVQLPGWTLDLLTADLVRSQFDRFAANDGDLTRTMESYGLRVNFYWDGPTGAAQTFGAQTNNQPLLSFPPTVEAFMYPAGSYLLLDSGSLDLGLVRDSVLNATNDYQIFAESWENLAFVGLESLRISAAVCDTGAVAAAVASVCGS